MEVLFTKTLPAQLESIPDLTKPLLDCARAEGITDRKVMKLDLALEEILTNIVYYSYADSAEAGEIEVSCGLNRETEPPLFMVEVADSGKPFDMTVEAAYPNISADIDNRKIGGLGIFLVKKTMDMVDYQREGNKNILRFGVH